MVIINVVFLFRNFINIFLRGNFIYIVIKWLFILLNCFWPILNNWLINRLNRLCIWECGFLLSTLLCLSLSCGCGFLFFYSAHKKQKQRKKKKKKKGAERERRELCVCVIGIWGGTRWIENVSINQLKRKEEQNRRW